MKKLWAPWRIEYIRSKKDEGCIFCCKPKMEDRNELILFRGKNSFSLKGPGFAGNRLADLLEGRFAENQLNQKN